MPRRVFVVDDDSRVRDAVCGLLHASDDLVCAGAVGSPAGVVLVDRMLPQEDVGLR